MAIAGFLATDERQRNMFVGSQRIAYPNREDSAGGQPAQAVSRQCAVLDSRNRACL